MKREVSLELALNIVKRDADQRAKYYRRQIGQSPFPGKSQEEHDAYYLEQAKESETAAYYCFIRQMQINPD